MKTNAKLLIYTHELNRQTQFTQIYSWAVCQGKRVSILNNINNGRKFMLWQLKGYSIAMECRTSEGVLKRFCSPQTVALKNSQNLGAALFCILIRIN